MVDSSPSNLDDLFDFAAPQTASTQWVAAEAAAPAEATPQQHGSRRQAREAQGKRSRIAKAARNRRELSRDSRDRKAVARAAREIDSAAPASRRLRRSETALVRAAAPKTDRKHPLSVLATMTVIGGMFAVAGLPAYAVTTQQADGQKTDVALQSVVVTAADTVAPATARDGYHATTPEEVAEMSKDAIRAQNNADYNASGARALGDDYPWFYELADYQGGGLSALNYYYRQCTDFVAWRLNRDAGSYQAPFKWVWSNLTPTGGNASQWEYAWQQHGWPVSNTPIVGSVAWFGWSNHVAYVKAVNADGTVTIEEYNYSPSVYTQRTIPASSVEAFLYPPT